MRVSTFVQVNIEHVPKLTDARRHLMMERMEFDESVEDTVMPLMMTIENLESDSNPYGIPMHERGDWAADLDVKVAEPAEYIYFAGCAASFDERNKKVARDTISIMKEAGLDVGISRYARRMQWRCCSPCWKRIPIPDAC